MIMATQLLKVTDTGNKAFGFKEGVTSSDNDYRYDDNGNMIMDKNKGIGTNSAAGITYNHLNLPTAVNINNGQDVGTISYIYDATGVKLRKIVSTGVTTDYAANYIYENNVLQLFHQPEGFVEPDGGSGYNYIYQYKDHLGNVRVNYTDINQNNANAVALEIVEEKNYYPFGLQHKGYNDQPSARRNMVGQRFGFGGKELTEELGLETYDFGARNYDASLGRWMNIDPLADKYHSISAYSYVANNPLFFKDPDGERIWIYYQDSDGNEQRVEYKNKQLYSESGKVYKPDGDFLPNIMDALDNLGSTDIGKVVLDKLVGSDNDFDLKNSTNKEESTVGFVANRDDKGNKTGGGTLTLGEDQSLETVSHELFHGYQLEENGDNYSINDEVGAYLFGQAVNEQYHSNLDVGYFTGGAGTGRSNEDGKRYEKAYEDLYYGNSFNLKSYESAINNFKKGSQRNLRGLYNNFPIKPIKKNKILISKFYPLFK